MDSLRWILLGAGIIFVLVIYLLGRSRKRRNHSMIDDLEGDLPEFSAGSLDDVDEGVGRVRVISSIDDDESDDATIGTEAHSGASDMPEHTAAGPAQKKAESSERPPGTADLIVLYILPKITTGSEEQLLAGTQINSAAQAMGLHFGDMSIYHFRRNERNVFSMANMLEPGSFDPATMHDMKTRGLTMFMQLHEANPMDDLTEMLQRSYQLAGLLDARLCNHKRTPLTEQDAEDYRQKVRNFIESKSFELSMEE